MILFRVRINTLQLNWRRNFTDRKMNYETCGTGAAITLEHFARYNTREKI